MPEKQENKFELKWMAVETTGRCNLNCVHCRCAEDLPDELSTDDLTGLLDHAASFASPVVVLSGGEPLLREDVFDVAAHGTGVGLRIGLATNGTLVTADIARRIKESGIKIVALSLDGATKQAHDSFRRQEGSFDAAVRAARVLRDEGVPFIVNSSFTKKNREDIKGAFELARSLGAKAWYMFMVVPTGRAEAALEDLLDADRYDEILRWHYEAEKGVDDILMRPTCAPTYYRVVRQMNRESDSPLEQRTLSFSTGGSKGCVAGQSICFIDRAGGVFPCSYFPMSAGSIKEKPLREIWENSELLSDIRDFSRWEGDCGICEYRNVCGGCRVRAHVLGDGCLAKDPMCNYVPKRSGGGE